MTSDDAMTDQSVLIAAASKDTLNRCYRIVALTGAIFAAIGFVSTVLLSIHLLSMLLITPIVYFGYAYRTGLYNHNRADRPE